MKKLYPYGGRMNNPNQWGMNGGATMKSLKQLRKEEAAAEGAFEQAWTKYFERSISEDPIKIQKLIANIWFLRGCEAGIKAALIKAALTNLEGK